MDESYKEECMQDCGCVWADNGSIITQECGDLSWMGQPEPPIPEECLQDCECIWADDGSLITQDCRDLNTRIKDMLLEGLEPLPTPAWFWAMMEIVLVLGTLIPVLVYLVVCFKDRIIRQDPSKWPCITYVLVAQTVRILYFIVMVTIPLNDQTMDGKYAGICFFVESMRSAKTVIGPVLLSFISVERMLALSRDVSSGISRKAAIIALTLILIIGYAIIAGSLGIIHSLHSEEPFWYDGCYFMYSLTTTFFLETLPFLFVFISTIVMSVLLCKASCNKGKAGATGKVLPYIVANMAYILYFACVFVLNGLFAFGYSRMYILSDVLLVIIILSWMLGDPTLRKAYQVLCCPCISVGINEEVVTLLENGKN